MIVVLVSVGSPFVAHATEAVSSTVYVGRHFELREHEQPIKYVFNGDTRAAEVIGSLSSNTRVQRLRLRSGWNLLSLAVTVSDLAGQLEHSAPGVVQSIYQWNPPPVTYASVGQGEAVAAGSVLWVKVRTNMVAGVTGAYAEPAGVHVPARGGYVAGTGFETWAPVLPTNEFAWTFDPVSPQWHESVSGSLAFLAEAPTVVAPGEAIYVATEAAVEIAPPDPALRVRYYHQDHLGSASAITDRSGALVNETALYPFGTPRHQENLRVLEEPYQFTQKERDRESRLHYFEARYLASGINRFVSVDHKFARPDELETAALDSFVTRPQSINLYSYTHNNPLGFTDPSGEDRAKPKQTAAAPEPEGSTLTLMEGGSEVLQLSVSSVQFSDVRGTRQPEGAAGNEQQRELTFSRRVDASSTALFNNSMAGKPLEGELTLRTRRGEHSEVYMHVTLTSVIVTGYQVSEGGQNGLTESFTISANVQFPVPQQCKPGEEQDAIHGTQSYAEPTPVSAPLRFLSDWATPPQPPKVQVPRELILRKESP